MSKKKAVEVLSRRRAYLQKQYETGYFSKSKSEHRVAAELAALTLAIDVLSAEGAA